MKRKVSQRGFRLSEFKDKMGEKCSIQESSIMDNGGLIWLGCDDVSIKHLGEEGWKDIDLKKLLGDGEIASNTRMMLSQSMVKKLLPLLEHFAEHGSLPSE